MKPKFLIADDSKSARLAVVEAFKGYECDVLQAADGVEGLAVARRERPDLILLDVAMPCMDGVEMLGRLQSDPGLRQIPVIMLTGEASRQMVVKIARMGVRDYLVKPFSDELLVERATRVVELAPKGEGLSAKQIQDALVVLVVDDKPAIPEQIRQAVSDTAWQVEGRNLPAEAIEFCQQTVPDLVLVSLSLPQDGAHALLRDLRADPRTRKVPVLGLSVRTATEEHKRALDAGIGGIVTKPIAGASLKSQICRRLKLDTSSLYFEEREGALILHVPEQASGEVAEEMLGYFPAKVAAAVEAGLDKMLIDLSLLRDPGPGLMELLVRIVRMCEELTLDFRIVGADNICAECRKHEDAKSWKFASSCDEAIMNWSSPEPMMA